MNIFYHVPTHPREANFGLLGHPRTGLVDPLRTRLPRRRLRRRHLRAGWPARFRPLRMARKERQTWSLIPQPALPYRRRDTLNRCQRDNEIHCEQVRPGTAGDKPRPNRLSRDGRSDCLRSQGRHHDALLHSGRSPSYHPEYHAKGHSPCHIPGREAVSLRG